MFTELRGLRPLATPSAPVAEEPDGRHDEVLAAVLTVVPGPDGTVTLVAQKGGPFAGRWMLPGGRIEVGETVERAAVRETREETGVVLSDLDLLGIYELRGAWGSGEEFHVLMTAFVAPTVHRVPACFVGDNGGGIQQIVARPSVVHSSDLRVLVDAGTVDAPDSVVERALARDGLRMTRLAPQSLP